MFDSADFAGTPIDRVRDFWNARPCNLRHSAAPVGTRQYFEEVEARKYFVEPHIPAFAQHERWHGKRVLEVGCGIGTDTIAFARAGALVTAVDLSERSVALTQQRAEVFGVTDRVRVLVADAERLSQFVEPRPYDLVYSFGVIHHSPHPDRILQQIRTHFVHADSSLKVMVYHRWSWKTLAIVASEAHGAVWRLDRVVAQHSEAQTGCPITYTYSRRSGSQLLERAGFEVLDAQVDHIFPYRVDAYVRHEYVKAMPFRLLPAGAMRALERRLGWHLCLDARPGRAMSS
jgi:2-polyprenyl-3-methyl-5-hydroxy-6-metoxy-1,4-benzoquinol methylase